MIAQYYYTLITVFVILAYLIITDQNAAPFFDLQLKIFGVNLRKWWMIATMYPRVKYQSWKLKREFEKIKKEFNLSDHERQEDHT